MSRNYPELAIAWHSENRAGENKPNRMAVDG
jgi:hypothetical protein